MSTFTVTIACPRGYESDDGPCGCEVVVECEADGMDLPATRWEPAEGVTLSVLSTLAACPETDTPYTPEERAEAHRLARAEMDVYGNDPGHPCRCGVVCRC